MSKKQNKRRMSRFYAFWRAIARVVIFPVCRPKFKGVENVPAEGAYIIASNHLSAADPICIGVGLKRQVMFMAKAELFKKKFSGGFLRRLGAFPVERGSSAAIDAIKHFEDVVKNGELMCIFIEGTRSKTGEFLPPKNGVSLIAYDTGTSVIPACITKKGMRRIVHFEKPLTLDELGFEKGGAREFRNASRMIMDRIKAIRELDLRD